MNGMCFACNDIYTCILLTCKANILIILMCSDTNKNGCIACFAAYSYCSKDLEIFLYRLAKRQHVL